ncbi:TetR family transcriptional regulator [Isoalcanivorax pacificus W11-5]|uniref:TetR family transcriptional regulator n=1 Tax=Isoalcanivorax pacificus W11-5 TaxID=391936 RepID=A0A0B4XKX2_9GAMM|nr:TetR/AcrR family transcriptional regulator [Isoalcanivorax pacificus]AJD47761.1 TetR family transcriptional regulator [Isoalcanivorax pacificus W11-5]
MSTPTPPKPRRGRAYRGVSIEARRAERHQKLLDAGIQVIGTQGYHATTVKAVCAEAGLTERYFYESFSNSEALLCEAYAHIIGQLRERIGTSLSAHQAQPDTLIEAALNSYFSYLRDHPGHARLMMVEVLGVSPTVDQHYRRVMEDFAEFLAATRRGLYPAQDTHGVDEMMIATGLIGALVNMAMRWMLSGFRESPESVVAAARTVLLAVNRHLLEADQP